MKRIAVYCALLTLSLVFRCPTSATNQLYLTEEEVAERSDWVIVLDATSLPNYLRYPGSRLCPITQVHVSYLNCLGKSLARTVLYEDLWYRDGQPIGCRRYSLLNMGKFDRRGTIFVRPSAAIANTSALANAIVRLSVDLNAHDVAAAAVIVPEEMHKQLLSDFGTFGFYKRVVRSGAQANIHLVSNPRVFDEYLYYKVSN